MIGPSSVFETRRMKKKTLKMQSKQEPPWPKINFGTRRMKKKKECEFIDNSEAPMAEFQVWNQKNVNFFFLKFQSKLEPPWPSNSFGTRRMKEKECEFSYKAEAGLGQYQVCNQKIEKKPLKFQSELK
jgi:hypothetical protein